jgi:putative transposase
VVALSARREMATKAVSLFAISIRLACNIFKVSEGCYRNQPMLADENQLIADWLLRITNNQRCSGLIIQEQP